MSINGCPVSIEFEKQLKKTKPNPIPPRGNVSLALTVPSAYAKYVVQHRQQQGESSHDDTTRTRDTTNRKKSTKNHRTGAHPAIL